MYKTRWLIIISSVDTTVIFFCFESSMSVKSKEVGNLLKNAVSQPQSVMAEGPVLAVEDLFLPLGRQLFAIVAHFNEREAISFRVCNTNSFNGMHYPTKKGKSLNFFNCSAYKHKNSYFYYYLQLQQFKV